jgi:hypothetical protein
VSNGGGFATATLSNVPADHVLSETIVFELQEAGGAMRLWERLRLRWQGDAYADDEGALVAVELGSEEGGLADLLRTVQFWAREDGLEQLTFHLDGRAYILDSATAIWPAAA